MKLVKFTKNVPAHSAFGGEVMGFADELADRLVKAGKAIYEAVAPAQPEPATDKQAEATTDAGEEDAAGDGGGAPAPPAVDVDEPKKRGPGRPRKAD